MVVTLDFGLFLQRDHIRISSFTDEGTTDTFRKIFKNQIFPNKGSKVWDFFKMSHADDVKNWREKELETENEQLRKENLRLRESLSKLKKALQSLSLSIELDVSNVWD